MFIPCRFTRIHLTVQPDQPLNFGIDLSYPETFQFTL